MVEKKRRQGVSNLYAESAQFHQSVQSLQLGDLVLAHKQALQTAQGFQLF